MTKDEKALQEKFIRMIKISNKYPYDKEVRKKLAAIWKQMDAAGA